jgi:predicted acylesterase/phospholipase RssA
MPIDVMAEMVEGGSVIAVDVIAQHALAKQYDFGASVSAWQVLLDRLPFRRARLTVPGIMDVFMRSFELASVRNRVSHLQRAALLINPPVEQFGLFELKSIAQLVQIGYEHTLKSVERWKAEVASSQ